MEPQGLRRESRAGLRFITVICPAHNEASSIGEVCRDVLALDMDLRLIVVDDGSSDGTGRIAQDAGAEVIAHRTNQGNGAAIKSGLAATRSEFAVIIDGDGQQDRALLGVPRHRESCVEIAVVGRWERGRRKAVALVALIRARLIVDLWL